MAELKTIGDRFANHATAFKAVVEAMDAIDKIGGMQQAADEAEARLQAAQRELGVAEAKTAANSNAVADAKQSAAEHIRGAETQAQEIVAEAQAEADRLSTHAKTLHDRALAKHQKDLDSWNKLEADAREAAMTAIAARDAAEISLVEVEAQLDAIRSKIG